VKRIIGEAFKGTVINRVGEYVIIRAKISEELEIGDPCRIDPYKFENEEERKVWERK